MGKPKLFKELNILIQKRDEVQEGLKQFRNKVANNSKLGHRLKSLLCQSTKQLNTVRTNLMKSHYNFIIYILILLNNRI